MKKLSNLSIKLNIIATIFAFPLIIAGFFDGYRADGIGVSIFEYVLKDSILLNLAFVSIVIMVGLVITLAVLNIRGAVKSASSLFVRVVLTAIQLLLTLLSFIFIIIFVAKNTLGYLSIKLGLASYIYFFSSLLFGVFTMFSYYYEWKN